MKLTEIQKKILISLIEKGEVTIQELMANLDKSYSSIYSNFDAITSVSIRKKRGGLDLVTHPASESVRPFHDKLRSDVKEKQELAEAIVSGGYIDHPGIAFLDCGSTTYYVAEKLIEHEKKGFNIATVNPYVLKKLLDYPDIGQISLIGGRLNWANGALFGPLTVKSLANVGEIATLILGIDALDSKTGEIGISNEFEVDQKALMIEKARKIIIPVTMNKINSSVSYPLKNIINDFLNKKDFLLLFSGKGTDPSEAIKDIISNTGSNYIRFAGDHK